MKFGREIASRFSDRINEFYARSALPRRLDVQAADAGTTEILIYDEIGYFGITAKAFVLALAQAGDGPLTVRINSPGGDVFDGLAIYNALKARTSPVNVVVDGLAASAASFIAMAGTSLAMNEQSMLMIHNAWAFVIGDRNDMLETAAVMEKIDGQLASIYAAKSGKDAKAISAMMDAETWFTSSEAKDAGLCDSVVTKPASTTAAASAQAASAAASAAAAAAQAAADVETANRAAAAAAAIEVEKATAAKTAADAADADAIRLSAMQAKRRRLRLAEAEAA